MPVAIPSTVSFSGIAESADGVALGGVDVCAHPDDFAGEAVEACTSTGADGSWTLAGVTANARFFIITFEKEGFVSTLRPIETAASDISLPAGEGGLIPLADAPAILGGGLDPSKGHVQFFADGASDVTVRAIALDGHEEDAAYLDGTSTPERSMTAGVQGVFANVAAAAYYVLTFRSATASCATIGGLYGYPLTLYRVAGEASLIVPVLDGYVTSPVRVDCSTEAEAASQ